MTLGWAAVLSLSAGRTDAGVALRRSAGSVRTPTSEILERAWLDALLAGDADAGRSLTLQDALALARRELAALAQPRDRHSEPNRGPAQFLNRHSAPDGGLGLPEPNRFVQEGSVWTISFVVTAFP